MNPKAPTNDTQHAAREAIPIEEIRLSPNAIAAAEKIEGRSLRSDVPDLPAESRQDG